MRARTNAEVDRRLALWRRRRWLPLAVVLLCGALGGGPVPQAGARARHAGRPVAARATFATFAAIAANTQFVGKLADGYPVVYAESDFRGRSLTKLDFWLRGCDPRHTSFESFDVLNSPLVALPGSRYGAGEINVSENLHGDPTQVQITIHFASETSGTGTMVMSEKNASALPPVSPYCGYGLAFTLTPAIVRAAPRRISYPVAPAPLVYRPGMSSILPVAVPSKTSSPATDGQMVIYEAHVGESCLGYGPLEYLRVTGHNQNGRLVTWSIRHPGLDVIRVGNGNPWLDYVHYYWWRGTITVSYRYANGFADTIQAYVPPISDINEPLADQPGLHRFDFAGAAQVYVGCSGTLEYETVLGLPHAATARDRLVCISAHGEPEYAILQSSYTGYTYIGAHPWDNLGIDVIGGFDGTGYAAILPRILIFKTERLDCLALGVEPGTEGGEPVEVP